MADRLYVRGLGYRHKAEKIFHDRENGGVIRASYEEHYPPDTNAALAWLARRQPGRWKERQEVSVTGTIAHRLAAMTPAERGAFAADLVAQAKRRLLEAGVIIDQEPAPPLHNDAELLEAGVVIDQEPARTAELDPDSDDDDVG